MHRRMPQLKFTYFRVKNHDSQVSPRVKLQESVLRTQIQVATGHKREQFVTKN